jgi:hypothetical protein
MIKHIDVLIRSNYAEHGELISIIEEFANSYDNWEYLKPQSQEYSVFTGAPSCALLFKNNKHHPAIAITNKVKNTFYVANIVPKESDRIDTSEYNEIAKAFAKDLNKYIKATRAKITVKLTQESFDLSSILPGVKSRQLFEHYLNLFPLSYHPCDIERLDVFICHLSRFSKNKVDTELLECWLINKKHWKSKDAHWCVNRINSGLDILKVNRKY